MEACRRCHRNPGAWRFGQYFPGSFRQGCDRCHNRRCSAVLSFATRGQGRLHRAPCHREMTANSSVEFLIWLLIAASVIAVIAKRIGIPYTVALVLGSDAESVSY